MKRILLTALAVFVLVFQPRPAHAEITIDFFYDSLQPYGDWLYVNDYGYCWQPSNVDANWRPYTDGYWTYTDSGWTWVSYEDWGWATYHYGRWVDLDKTGWVWVPGYEWGPAWVSWRYSDQYIGWAPLPPQAVCTPDEAINDYVDADYDLGPEYYTFTTSALFGSPSLRPVIIRPETNITIINQTVNVTNIFYNNGLIINRGPRYEIVARHTERPIERLKIDRVDLNNGDDSRSLFSRKHGGSLTVIAPRVSQTNQDQAPRKVREKITATSLNHGWSGIKDPAVVAQTRQKMKAEIKKPRPAQVINAQSGLSPAQILRREALTPNTQPSGKPRPVATPEVNQNQSRPKNPGNPKSSKKPPLQDQAADQTPQPGKKKKSPGKTHSTPEQNPPTSQNQVTQEQHQRALEAAKAKQVINDRQQKQQNPARKQEKIQQHVDSASQQQKAEAIAAAKRQMEARRQKQAAQQQQPPSQDQQPNKHSGKEKSKPTPTPAQS